MGTVVVSTTYTNRGGASATAEAAAAAVYSKTHKPLTSRENGCTGFRFFATIGFRS